MLWLRAINEPTIRVAFPSRKPQHCLIKFLSWLIPFIKVKHYTHVLDTNFKLIKKNIPVFKASWELVLLSYKMCLWKWIVDFLLIRRNIVSIQIFQKLSKKMRVFKDHWLSKTPLHCSYSAVLETSFAWVFFVSEARHSRKN